MCVFVYMCLWFVIFYCEFIFSVGHDRLRIPTREEIYCDSEVFGCGAYWSLSNRKYTGKESAETGLRFEINIEITWPWRQALVGCGNVQSSCWTPRFSCKSLRLACRIHN